MFSVEHASSTVQLQWRRGGGRGGGGRGATGFLFSSKTGCGISTGTVCIIAASNMQLAQTHAVKWMPGQQKPREC